MTQIPRISWKQTHTKQEKESERETYSKNRESGRRVSRNSLTISLHEKIIFPLSRLRCISISYSRFLQSLIPHLFADQRSKRNKILMMMMMTPPFSGSHWHPKNPQKNSALSPRAQDFDQNSLNSKYPNEFKYSSKPSISHNPLRKLV